MRLKVSLIYKIYSELIAQLIPAAPVRIMACPYSVDIKALYYPYILKKLLLLKCPSVHT